MTPDLILFLVLALVAVASALGMLFSTNAVYSALFLILNFATVAVFYLILGAAFIAITQITVYAGAIMVLFLFVIMLLHLGEEDIKLVAKPKLHFVGAVVAVAFLGALVWVARRAGLFEMELTPIGPAGETANVAVPLFQEYVLPFEIASFLLLSAIVGSVLITKRRLR